MGIYIFSKNRSLCRLLKQFKNNFDKITNKSWRKIRSSRAFSQRRRAAFLLCGPEGGGRKAMRWTRRAPPGAAGLQTKSAPPFETARYSIAGCFHYTCVFLRLPFFLLFGSHCAETGPPATRKFRKICKRSVPGALTRAGCQWYTTTRKVKESFRKKATYKK